MGRKLGQHFLISEKKLRKAAESLDLKNGDTVIEVGPGHGELTREIQKLKIKNKNGNSKIKIVAIEKDKGLAEGLRLKFKDSEVKIMEGDALEILPDLCSKFRASSFKIAGNIPYYITGHLFRVIGDLENKPEVCVFTVQEEVAERICSKPPQMNLLAASVGFWAEPKIISRIPKKYFRPEPKVDSATIKLVSKPPSENPEHYYFLAKAIFKQPRKTVLNNLASGFKGMKKEEIIKKLEKAGINPKDRPQNVEIGQLAELSQLIQLDSST